MDDLQPGDGIIFYQHLDIFICRARLNEFYAARHDQSLIKTADDRLVNVFFRLDENNVVYGGVGKLHGKVVRMIDPC